MGIRQRLEEEFWAALRDMGDAATDEGGQVNRATRVNAVVVSNTADGGTAVASAEQSAPIIQGPRPKQADPEPRVTSEAGSGEEGSGGPAASSQ